MVTQAMIQSGTDAVMINTDYTEYGGTMNELQSSVRMTKQFSHHHPTAVIMKDIIVDEFQLGLAKYYGADAIILMSCVLGPSHINFIDIVTTWMKKQELEYYNAIVFPQLLVLFDSSNLYHSLKKEMISRQQLHLSIIISTSYTQITFLATINTTVVTPISNIVWEVTGTLSEGALVIGQFTFTTSSARRNSEGKVFYLWMT
jgi:Indole-3-glycerol phosphate synthase